MTDIRFHLVSYTGEVLRTVAAGSLREAVQAFGWTPSGETFVTSAASLALGLPKALSPSRCTSCGLREHIEGRPHCTVCYDHLVRERKRKADERVKARSALRSKDRRGRIITGRQVQAARDAQVLAGIARRAAKRRIAESSTLRKESA